MTKDNHKLGQFDLNGIPPAPRGTPQIEVTFEVDANGILNVQAEDKGTGKKEKITITAEKGRLSQEEIDRMVKEAEEFADADKAVRAKIDAKNQLESYIYQVKSTVEDKAKDKIEADDKKKLLDSIKEAQEWIDDNTDATADEFNDKRKEVEDVAGPIMAKLYKDAGGAGGAGGGGSDDLGDHDEL